MAAVGGGFHTRVRAPLIRGLPCSTKWRSKTPDLHRTDRSHSSPKADGIGEWCPRAPMSIQRSAYRSAVSLADFPPPGGAAAVLMHSGFGRPPDPSRD